MDIIQIDMNYRTRDVAPLKPAEDAITIDTTDLSLEEVVKTMLRAVEKI
jgi:cytidylate kinase